MRSQTKQRLFLLLPLLLLIALALAGGGGGGGVHQLTWPPSSSPQLRPLGSSLLALRTPLISLGSALLPFRLLRAEAQGQ